MIREAFDNLDKEFIAHAADCSSFNIITKYFESTDKKEEIRHLIQVNWFDGHDITYYDKFSAKNYQAGVNQLRALNRTSFEKLFFYEKKGFGPGEILTYFLFDDVSLGGGKSAGIDIISSTGYYEMKSVVPSISAGNIWGKGEFISNFMLGGTVGLDKLVTELKDLKKEATKIDKKYGKAKEVGLTHYAFFAQEFPTRWEKVYAEYQTLAYNYLSKSKLFCVANESKASYTLGDIILFGNVKKKHILMGNQTKGSIKPIIRIK